MQIYCKYLVITNVCTQCARNKLLAAIETIEIYFVFAYIESVKIED